LNQGPDANALYILNPHNMRMWRSGKRAYQYEVTSSCEAIGIALPHQSSSKKRKDQASTHSNRLSERAGCHGVLSLDDGGTQPIPLS
jgi:hypothetical protein